MEILFCCSLYLYELHHFPSLNCYFGGVWVDPEVYSFSRDAMQITTKLVT